MRLLYFAWVRAKIGTAEETIDPPGGIATVAQLIEWLKARGPNYAEALEERKAACASPSIATMSAGTTR